MQVTKACGLALDGRQPCGSVIYTPHMPTGMMNRQGAIQEYVDKNPDCKLPKTVSVMLHGQRRDLVVYRLPLEMTFYNIKNGRFAAEYAELVKKEGRELDSTNVDDAAKIQKLLAGLNSNQHTMLQNDVLKNGQKDPGIITHDGFVINGNRRRSVLEELASAGQSKFAYIEVGILPSNVTAKDLWMIEAGIQMARNVQLEYGPINELLKFKEGYDVGLSAIEIAESIYGGFKEKDIKKKLEEHKLVSEYLNFIHEPGNFQKAKGVHEHIVYLRNILDDFKNKSDATRDMIAIATRIAFQIIHDGVQAREFRRLKNMLERDAVRSELWEALEYSKPEPSRIKMQKKRDAEQNDAYTESRTIFNNCVDSLNALKDAKNPEKLLGKALKNLKAVDTDHASLANPNIVGMIDEAIGILNSFKSDPRP